MRKILLPSLALIVLGCGAYVFRAEFETPVTVNASATPARPHSAHERALMSQQELLDSPAAAEESLIPGEFLRTVRAIPSESSIEFLARRSQGQAEGRFERHTLEAVFDERTGSLVRVEGSIDLDSLASPSASLLEMIRQGAFFGDSDRKTCAIRSVRIHPALTGQLPNRANALIEAEVTIAGVRKPVSIPVRTELTDDHVLTLQGEFMLDRAAFGLPVEPRSAESVKNELVVRLNVRARASEWNAAEHLPQADAVPAGTSKAGRDSSVRGSARGISN
ncbi:hypothetical protein GC170_19820 [bacterium]|nr:hypothetical protein [bacterium]